MLTHGILARRALPAGQTITAHGNEWISIVMLAYLHDNIMVYLYDNIMVYGK